MLFFGVLQKLFLKNRNCDFEVCGIKSNICFNKLTQLYPVEERARSKQHLVLTEGKNLAPFTNLL